MLEESASNSKQQFIMALVAAAALVYMGRLGADKLVASIAPIPAAGVKQSVPAPQTNAVNEDDRIADEARRERVPKEQALIEQDRLRREAKKAAAIAAFTDAANAAQQEQALKDEAWQRFYKRPGKCDNPPDQLAMVECSNHFMRAQQRFEKLYAEGKISAPATAKKP